MMVVTATRNRAWPADVAAGAWPPSTWGLSLDDLLIASDWELKLGLVGCYQWAYEQSNDPLLIYAHDDLEIHEEGWWERVEAEFEDETVGVVGFGGATRHGHPDIYRRPYKLQQLARFDYHSNTTDAEEHGHRFDGSMDVAVLDGFCLAVRREVLDRAWLRTDPGFRGGWPVDKIKFHTYDYYLCAMAHRLGYRVRVVGVKCKHLGGRTSTTKEYQDWLAERGTTDQKDHEESHRWIYEEFRDVLPWEVKG